MIEWYQRENPTRSVPTRTLIVGGLLEVRGLIVVGVGRLYTIA